MPGKKPHKGHKPKKQPSGKLHPRARKPEREAKQSSHYALPDTLVVTVSHVNDDGEAIAVPTPWNHRHKPPHVIITSCTADAPAVGQRALARLTRISKHAYEAHVIKVLPDEKPQTIVGTFLVSQDKARIEPADRRLRNSFIVERDDQGGAKHGELVAAIVQAVRHKGLGLQYAKVTTRIGTAQSPGAFSLIAIHTHGLPTEFSPAALAMAEEATPPVMEAGREDLRKIPLVTIDGADARDFDDAVFAEPDGSNWHVIVAIADVAHYVPEDSALDIDAFERGNSAYFPDRVVPMLPAALSNGLCSLNPDEDRYCLAVHLWIDAHGHTTRYRFVRGIMCSHRRFTYEDIQRIADNEHTHPLYAKVVAPLYGAYAALTREWEQRGALDLNLPEHKVTLDDKGSVSAIIPRERLTSHRLIEAYMVAANVAAADYLVHHRAGGIFRVHEPPSIDKLDELRRLLDIAGYGLSKGSGISAQHFNKVLRKSEGTPEAYMVHTAVLRSQMQAFYRHENVGHFGLGLQKYCHFTSPIRRYADLMVHRALIAHLAHDKNAREKLPHTKRRELEKIADHISITERKAMLAERDSMDRYRTAYMSARLGQDFGAAITGINKFGLYATISDIGVTGFVPVRALGEGFFRYDERHSCFREHRGERRYRLGDPLVITVEEANSLTGNLIFSVKSVRDEEVLHLRPRKKPKGKPHRHKR